MYQLLTFPSQHSLTSTHTHTHALSHTTHTHMHPYTHTHAHTRVRTHTHTHTHTYTPFHSEVVPSFVLMDIQGTSMVIYVYQLFKDVRVQKIEHKKKS